MTITSGMSDFNILVSNLSQFNFHPMKRGYNETEIDPIIYNTLLMNRIAMLNYKINMNDSDIALVMVTQFDTRIRGLKQKLLKHWKATPDKYYKKYSKMNLYWLTKSTKTLHTCCSHIELNHPYKGVPVNGAPYMVNIECQCKSRQNTLYA